jgi:flagellar FliJ protein
MAKKFKFRFEPMLKVKEHREKERQRELAETLAKVHDQKAALRKLDTKRLDTMDHHRSKLVGRVSMAEALVCSRYLLRLKRERMAGNELLRGMEREAESRRQKLVEAARERKVYDLLKEKQATRHRHGLEKDEQKALDEVATNNFRRKTKKR